MKCNVIEKYMLIIESKETLKNILIDASFFLSVFVITSIFFFNKSYYIILRFLWVLTSVCGHAAGDIRRLSHIQDVFMYS